MPDLDPAHGSGWERALRRLPPEHLNAIAGCLSESEWLPLHVRYGAAASLLTSTDPDVHAALLAALVRAEVLRTEEWPKDEVPTHHRYVTRWGNVDA